MAGSMDAIVPSTGFDPADSAVQRDPYPYYRWLLRNDPVHQGALGIWFVSRYADVRTVMGRPAFARAGIRDFWAAMVGPGPLSEIMRHTLFFQDEPDHGRLRGLITPVFTPRRMRALRDRIDAIADELLARVVPTGRMDVISDFAYPLALTVMTGLLGIPDKDRDRFRGWSLDIGPVLDLAASPEEIQRGQRAMGEFVDYLRDLAARRLEHPGDDLLSHVLAVHAEDESAITMDEVLAVIITLVFAGHETVTNQIGNAQLALIRHPDQLSLLRAGPDRLDDAVEELIRYDSSVQSNSRQLEHDTKLHGKILREGDFVVGLLGAANRDPAEFDDPDRLDVTRARVQPMSFGAGMRFCLGAALARLEVHAALARLIELDEVRLAVPETDLVYQRSTMFRGLMSLPVTFARP